MYSLLREVIDAHGGMRFWQGFEKVEATIVTGGGFFPLKGLTQDADPRRMTVWLHEERASVMPYGAPDQRTMFTPDRIAVEKLDGTLIAERRTPKDSFAGHQMNTPWDPLHRAYFNGEALWTYLTTPFLLAMKGVRVDEVEPWYEGAEKWRVLRAYFPGSFETHCGVQDFFIDAELMVRRHDYNVNIAGGFGAAQLISNYIAANGILLPTQRRAYARDPDRLPIPEMLMVSIDLSDVSFS